MSADNYTQCPRCNAERKAKIDKMEADVAVMYGKVPAEEFDRARNALLAERTRKLDDTFREYYEFYGAEDGEVFADYGGECQKCGLKCEFKHSVVFWPEASK